MFLAVLIASIVVALLQRACLPSVGDAPASHALSQASWLVAPMPACSKALIVLNSPILRKTMQGGKDLQLPFVAGVHKWPFAVLQPIGRIVVLHVAAFMLPQGTGRASVVGRRMACACARSSAVSVWHALQRLHLAQGPRGVIRHQPLERAWVG